MVLMGLPAARSVVQMVMHADPGAAGGLGDAQARLGTGVSGPGYRPRLDFEHALNRSVVVMSAPTLPKTTPPG